MTTPATMKEEFDKFYSNEGGNKLNSKQLWLLVKFAKYVRLRARNNAAFNNLCNQVFPYAKFTTVTKRRVNKITGKEESYPGLSIMVEGEPAITEDTNTEGEE
jgi:hypothetical protein